MFRRSPSQIYRPVTRNWPKFWGLGLLCVVLLVTAASTYAAILFTRDMLLVSTRAYAGRVEQLPEQYPLVLPANLALGEILVQQGEHVRKGQTLATLDQAGIDELINALEQKLIVKIVERRCLLSPDQFDNVPTSPGNELTEIDVAIQSCRATYSAYDSQRQAILESRLAILSEREKLLEELKRLLSLANLSNTNTLDTTSLAYIGRLQLMLNDVNLEMNVLAEAITQLKNGRDTAIAERQQQLSEEISLNEELITSLQRAKSLPRLLSPGDGVIRRIRPVQPGINVRQDIELLEIQSHRETPYEASFQLPLEDVDMVSEGQQVTLTMENAMTGQVFEFAGTIGKIEANGSGLAPGLTAQLLMSEEFQNVVQNPMMQGSFVEINVALNPEPLGMQLVPTLQDATTHLSRLPL